MFLSPNSSIRPCVAEKTKGISRPEACRAEPRNRVPGLRVTPPCGMGTKFSISRVPVL